MSKRMYEDLKEILCHELNEITRKGDIDKESLDDVYKLSSAITMVESLMKKQGGMNESDMQMSNQSNQSNHMPMWAYEGSNASYNMSNERGVTDGRDNPRSRNSGASNRNYSNESYNSMDSYESYRRGRGADGRYVSRDGSYDSYDSYGSYERGYSRHDAEEKVVEKLEDILETTNNPKIHNAIKQAMSKIRQ